MAGEADKVWDVAIVGSGFAGALIANKLGKTPPKRHYPRSRRGYSA